jgi:hypothetical protein
VSNYWYAVNDTTKEYVFVVGQRARPSGDHVLLYLRDNGLDWAFSFRLVGDFDDELEDRIEKTYTALKHKRPMFTREYYDPCGSCGAKPTEQCTGDEHDRWSGISHAQLPPGWGIVRYRRQTGSYHLSVSRFQDGERSWAWFLYKVVDPTDPDGTSGGWVTVQQGYAASEDEAMHQADRALDRAPLLAGHSDEDTRCNTCEMDQPS